MNIGIGSGDGNSIFEIAAKYEKMQLREMRKNIETIKQGLRSGTDTGSIKFLDDMEKLSGLVLQLKVKTGFIVADDLEPLVNDEIEKAKIDLDYDNTILPNTYVKIAIKQAEDLTKPIGNKQYETWFNEIKALTDETIMSKLVAVIAFKEAYLDKFAPTSGRTQESYVLFGSINTEIDRLKALIKSKMNTTKIMSTTAFEKLNTISDTIPNIINQILSLATEISRTIVKKITEWSTEISNEDLSRVIDTSNELVEDVALINSKAGIQPYITIYKKLKKPIEDIYKSVNEMGKLAGVISYDDNVNNQFKYTNATGDQGAETNEEAIQRTIGTIERMFAGVKVLILNRSPKKQVIDALNTINQALKDNNLYNDDMAPSFDLLNKKAKSKAKGDQAWITQTEVDIDGAIEVISDSILTNLQSTGISGAGKIKGAGKFMHSYHAKRFL
jgi:hypothetical protein